jgi:hypothetical protein
MCFPIVIGYFQLKKIYIIISDKNPQKVDRKVGLVPVWGKHKERVKDSECGRRIMHSYETGT